MIDDQSTLDEGEWEPYEIHSINNMGIINDLNK